jgi:hypothetical protein
MWCSTQSFRFPDHPRNAAGVESEHMWRRFRAARKLRYEFNPYFILPKVARSRTGSIRGTANTVFPLSSLLAFTRGRFIEESQAPFSRPGLAPA